LTRSYSTDEEILKIIKNRKNTDKVEIKIINSNGKISFLTFTWKVVKAIVFLYIAYTLICLFFIGIITAMIVGSGHPWLYLSITQSR